MNHLAGKRVLRIIRNIRITHGTVKGAAVGRAAP
jgi:hypothetical protein